MFRTSADARWLKQIRAEFSTEINCTEHEPKIFVGNEAMNYNQHLKLKVTLYNAGLVGLVIGTLGFLLVSALAILNIHFQKMTELIALGIVLITAGTTLMLISKNLGWHKSRVFNFLLNQLSIIMILVGFLGIGTSINTRTLDRITLIFLLFVVLGLSLVGLGMKFNIHPEDI